MVMEGKDLDLECLAVGKPTPRIRWYQLLENDLIKGKCEPRLVGRLFFHILDILLISSKCLMFDDEASQSVAFVSNHFESKTHKSC